MNKQRQTICCVTVNIRICGFSTGCIYHRNSFLSSGSEEADGFPQHSESGVRQARDNTLSGEAPCQQACSDGEEE